MIELIGRLSGPLHDVAGLWSITGFGAAELSRYARREMVAETRKGLTGLCLVALTLLLSEAVLFVALGLSEPYRYTVLLLAALAFHVLLSVRAIDDLRTLQVLGMTLLVVSAMAFALLAHRSGGFEPVLLASVALLFMVIPMVPWGLREALLVSALIYGLVTFSVGGGAAAFNAATLLVLQFVMVAASLISVALVARNASLRKSDLRARHALEAANTRMRVLSNQDPLTGAWNRRYLKDHFPRCTAAWRAAGRDYHFAFIDIDDFKQVNDRYGHDAGDAVLVRLSESLRAQLGAEGGVVRMGGDEFALLFTAEQPESLLRCALDGLADCAQAKDWRDFPVVGLSVGLISVPPKAVIGQREVYALADEALYEAKACKAASPGQLHLVIRRLTGADPTGETP